MKKILLVFTLYFGLWQSGYAQKIAVIGGGASGVVTAWLLEQKNDVTLYEAQDRLGGNVRTERFNLNGSPIVTEVGAEFFSPVGYENFLKLLTYLKIPLMYYTPVATYSRVDQVDDFILPPVHDGKIEWVSFTPKNLLRSLEYDTVKNAAEKIMASHNTAISLQDFLSTLKLDEDFKDQFLYPFLAGMWGVSIADIKTFAAYDALGYTVYGADSSDFHNFGAPGGIDTYFSALQNSLQHTQIKLNTEVAQLQKNNTGYTVITKNGESENFDQVVIATNAKVAAKLIKDIPEETTLSNTLSQVRYFATTIALHGDKRFMPSNHDDWRVVNIRYDGVNAETTVYKSWESPESTPVFKTWMNYVVLSPNDPGPRLPKPLYGLFYFQHPIADQYYFQAQAAILAEQGKHQLWFAGNWTADNDSHESAIKSAIYIGKALVPGSERLKVFD